MPRGQSVRVVAVDGGDAIARRLDDLGLRTGVEVVVLRRAPLGDPTVFELHGYPSKENPYLFNGARRPDSRPRSPRASPRVPLPAAGPTAAPPARRTLWTAAPSRSRS